MNSIYDYDTFYILNTEYRGLHQIIPYVFDTAEGAEKAFNADFNECIYKVENGFTTLVSYHYSGSPWVRCENSFPFMTSRDI